MLLGIDPSPVLLERDPDVIAVWQAAANLAFEQNYELDKQRATLIANAVWEAWK